MRPRTTVGAVTPAAASIAVRGLLEGPERSGRWVAVLPGVAYARVGARVLALCGPRAPRVPIALVAAGERPLAAGEPVVVGGGRLRGPGVDLVVRRWWAPRTPRPAVSAPALRRGATVVAGPRSNPGGSLRRLAAAARARDPYAVADAARALLGAGPGLTPAGDDVLVGWLAGLRAWDPDAAVLLSAWPSPGGRTTALSAELLARAADGLVVDLLVDLLDAMGGHGPVGPALARLDGYGASTGRMLALGARTAALAATGDLPAAA